MTKLVRLVERPIRVPREEYPYPSRASGSLVEFFGLVRGEEDGKAIGHLDYEAVGPMAEHQMHKIIDELAAEFPVQLVEVVHRVGAVPVGEPAIYVRVVSKHRGEGFGFLGAFCDRLKQDVPIWKAVPKP